MPDPGRLLGQKATVSALAAGRPTSPLFVRVGGAGTMHSVHRTVPQVSLMQTAPPGMPASGIGFSSTGGG